MAALDGFSPLEVLRMQFLENDVLALHNAWIPLNSSFTTYTSIDDKTNNIILAMVFLKEETSEVYKKWCNYELS